MKKRKWLIHIILPVYIYLQNRSLAKEMYRLTILGGRIAAKAADKEAAKELGHTEKTVWECLRFQANISKKLKTRADEYPYAGDMLRQLDDLEIRNLEDCKKYGTLLSELAREVIWHTGPMYLPILPFIPYVNYFDIFIAIILFSVATLAIVYFVHVL
ncbi:hypothetical protein CEB3_c21420 [Peptococcaceae bacterium CEB3]|nr:hypothetical protein CEB3_c21420 [Peptococcaceae bacterium CEB3]